MPPDVARLPGHAMTVPAVPSPLWERPDFDLDPTPPVDAIQADRWSLALRRNHARLAEDRARYEALREDLDRWLADLTAGTRRRIDWLEESLLAWHRAQPTDSALKLAGATLSARRVPPEIVVDDPDAFEAWAMLNRPDLLRVEPVRSELRRLGVPKLEDGEDGHLVDPQSGEVVAGVRAVGKPKSYSVKVRES